jgi:hypothetical protein
VKAQENGNLRILFRKKALISETITLPSPQQVELIINSFKEKDWLNYLFKGKGILKPIKKLNRLTNEMRLKNITPRELLDSIG